MTLTLAQLLVHLGSNRKIVPAVASPRVTGAARRPPCRPTAVAEMLRPLMGCSGISTQRIGGCRGSDGGACGLDGPGGAAVASAVPPVAEVRPRAAAGAKAVAFSWPPRGDMVGHCSPRLLLLLLYLHWSKWGGALGWANR